MAAGCSTALSPYAADDGQPDRADEDGPPPTRGTTSAPARPSSGARTTPDATDAGNAARPSPPAPDAVALFDPELPLPNCDIANLSDDCPDIDTVLASAGRDLRCRRNQVGARCAYPSPADSANLLECVLEDGSSPRWQFRRERCKRSCFSEMPTSFTQLFNADCLERPVTPCERAGTGQTAIDEALKEIVRACGGGSPNVYGLLLDDNGCGRALFLLENGQIAKCVSDTMATVRFGCSARCASTFEPGDALVR